MEELRDKINEIDDKLVTLFIERMEIADKIGAYKRERGLPVYDRSREQAVLARLTDSVEPEFADYIKTLYNAIFEMSRAYQEFC